MVILSFSPQTHSSLPSRFFRNTPARTIRSIVLCVKIGLGSLRYIQWRRRIERVVRSPEGCAGSSYWGNRWRRECLSVSAERDCRPQLLTGKRDSLPRGQWVAFPGRSLAAAGPVLFSWPFAQAWCPHESELRSASRSCVVPSLGGSTAECHLRAPFGPSPLARTSTTSDGHRDRRGSQAASPFPCPPSASWPSSGGNCLKFGGEPIRIDQ